MNSFECITCGCRWCTEYDIPNNFRGKLDECPLCIKDNSEEEEDD